MNTANNPDSGWIIYFYTELYPEQCAGKNNFTCTATRYSCLTTGGGFYSMDYEKTAMTAISMADVGC